MASNPSPDGNYMVPGKVSLDTEESLNRYWNKFSCALLDRIAVQNQSETGDTPEILNKLSSSPEDSTSNPQAPENLDLLGGEDDN